MISGIVIAKDMSYHGFPLDLCLKTWSKVCDEIVIVMDRKDPLDLQVIQRAAESIPNVKIRAVIKPNSFEIYRFVGYFACSNPDYVIHFDSDYLISDDEGMKLRKAIEEAPEDNDIITFRLMYLNYHGDMLYYDHVMKEYVLPYDGYSGTYPFVLNVKRQNFIMPVETFSERHNNAINMESVINLGSNWGGTYDQKYNKYWPGGNPDGFNIIDSDVIVEHLTWSINHDALEKKLDHSHWKASGVTLETVKGGDVKYDKSYPELEEIRYRFRR